MFIIASGDSDRGNDVNSAPCGRARRAAGTKRGWSWLPLTAVDCSAPGWPTALHGVSQQHTGAFDESVLHISASGQAKLDSC
jgi:hypothetical protein